MLRFTDEQQAFVLANRRQFNASQIAMAETMVKRLSAMHCPSLKTCGACGIVRP